jgi:hypothetical protein
MKNSSNAPKVLATLRAGNEISKRYQEKVAADQAREASVKAVLPEAVSACVDNDRIFGDQSEKVAAALSNPETGHAACMTFIRDLAKHRNAGEIDSIGTPLGQEKTASARGATGSRVADFDETDAGRAFSDRLLRNRS